MALKVLESLDISMYAGNPDDPFDDTTAPPFESIKDNLLLAWDMTSTSIEYAAAAATLTFRGASAIGSSGEIFEGQNCLATGTTTGSTGIVQINQTFIPTALSASGEYTICFFAKRSMTPIWGSFFTHGIYNYHQCNQEFLTNGSMRIREAVTGNSYYYWTSSGQVFPDVSAPLFICVTYKRAGRGKIYFNGVEVRNVGVSSEDFNAGAYTYFALGGHRADREVFPGFLSQLRIYDRQITDEEVLWLYNSGSGRLYSELAP